MLLRTWRETDLEEYFRTCNTEAVMLHLGGPRTKQMVRREVADLIEQQKDYGFTLWVLEDRASEEFVGFCGLDQLDYLEVRGSSFDPGCTVKGELELGVRLREDRWNKGLATEASTAALDFAFKKLRARRVVSRAERSNAGSRTVLEKLGFFHDFGLDYWVKDKLNLVYTITGDEWLCREPVARPRSTPMIESR